MTKMAKKETFPASFICGKIINIIRPGEKTPPRPGQMPMKSQSEYMSDARLDPEMISRLARDIGREEEYPCGWSWDMECKLDCPLRDKRGIRKAKPSDERLKCVFDARLMDLASLLFLARTWNAVQLMGMDLDDNGH